MFATTVVGPVPLHAGAQPQLQPSQPTSDPAQATAGNSAGNATEQSAQALDAERTRRPTEGEAATKPNGEALSEAELRQVEQMKVTDQEIRRHELAHQVAGGAYTGAPSYSFERGPDGNRYVVAGEVPIDYGPVQGDPRATMDKMQQVIAAALAPADPSPKDHQVAARARGYMMAAQLELAQQQSEMNGAREGAAAGEKRAAPTPDESNEPRGSSVEASDRIDAGHAPADLALSRYDIIARTVSSGAQEALRSLA
ncbi:SprA-related family protein [Halomonas shengliensis]|uniref:SprA-related family protein n=1 Tax=Halomonas shengliensis TaxID=419597 RepID=A0A1H0EU08_9GAMM|nr:putative metalloprotease CJM1_0395 family protein [Halomonas shengliensis]SDN85815.1 SprA-related family protein [Halomonas shengliensis]